MISIKWENKEMQQKCVKGMNAKEHGKCWHGKDENVKWKKQGVVFVFIAVKVNSNYEPRRKNSVKEMNGLEQV